ncbi:hypothetical protein F5J12DRAFT_904353 [Pisolithus orientalis]|uniref:uncharacterized protein n=1 Tax=Pisolithus orientalis TaxID=936130 RepID=UPI0022241FC5|nr:uncharacterized protein F5J12DRAFT_904353 [Pisolithus orientalis]KAI6014979.1 hypothetical protein F5J12DRAFT_904353 [Pisolithus orientalis]
MDSRRAETLQALSAYVEHQRTLLARTQADIERLKQLKTGRRSSHLNATIRVYPTPLRTLAIRTRLHHTQCSVPQPTQRSPLSALQRFVKDARKIIIDPVLESICGNPHTSEADPISTTNSLHELDCLTTTTTTLPASLSEDESQQPTPLVQESATATRKRERACAKIRELKKRKVRPDLVVGCKLGEEGSDSVFVRHDMEDESAAVDVSVDTPAVTPVDGSFVQEDTAETKGMDTCLVTPSEQAGCSGSSRSNSGPPVYTDTFSRPSRTRKPSLKLQSQDFGEPRGSSPLQPPTPSLGKRSRDACEVKTSTRKPKTEQLSPVTELTVEASKLRSDTYKQAWSISEQHLLERLLEEIPDGERNRWAKISQAMGGRRTPRQVASRVQKYFEKLKRFGLDVDNGKGSVGN